jgi:hypothetical protein
VLLDMEPKVVAAAHEAGVGAWHYSKAASLTRQPGSGNNWAQGAMRHAPAVSQQVLSMLRRQAERCDTLSGFLIMQASDGSHGARNCFCSTAALGSMLQQRVPDQQQQPNAPPSALCHPQSMAGGTGSGLGSAMTAVLRDEFPAARILNHCIWCALRCCCCSYGLGKANVLQDLHIWCIDYSRLPQPSEIDVNMPASYLRCMPPGPCACRPYDSGDVVVQPYNCMLTLSSLA